MSAAPSTNCLNPGDEIVILHMNGSGPNKGNYEFLRVGTVIGDTVYFTTGKTNYYGTAAADDAGVGAAQTVYLQRVPNYDDVILEENAILKGRIFIRVKGSLTGDSTSIIHANALGFSGGAWFITSNVPPGALEIIKRLIP